jgi:WD40 repeat protein
MYTTGGDGKILKWDLESEEKEFTVIAENPFVQRALDITSDGKWLICGTDQSNILLFNLENSVEQDQVLAGHTSFVTGLAVASDNSFFISSSNDKTIRKWNLASLESEVIITSESRINAIELSPDASQMVVGTQDGKISLYDFKDLSKPVLIGEESKNGISSLAYNHKGSWLVVGDSKGKVQVFDTDNYNEIKNLEGHKARIYDIDFNPSDSLFATSSLDGTVRVWDCTNLNNQPIELKDHESWVLSISFTPDGKKLVTSSNKKDRILIWDTKPESIAAEIVKGINRNMTQEEWNNYVAEDIPYEKTLTE